MKHTVLILTALATTGCTFCREHENTCTVIAGVGAVSLAIYAAKGDRIPDSGVDGRDYTITPVDCSTGSCK